MFSLQKKSYGILQILPTFEMGGVEQGTLDLACFLKEAGHRPVIVTSEGSKILQAQAKGVVVLTLPVASKNPLLLVKNVSHLKRICKEFHIDLVHARSRAPAWSAWQAAKLMNLPFVTTFHGTYNFSDTLLGSVKKYYNSIMVRGDRVIAISDFIRQHILLHYGKWIDPQNLRLIYRGVDTTYFNPEKVDIDTCQALRKEWNLPLDQPIFLMPGRLTSWKGQEAVLKMLAALAQGIVVFLGSSQGREGYETRLQKMAFSLGIKERVRFVTSCSHMREAYSLATIVLHASTDPEAFGRIIAEAQAMGKPIVVSCYGAGHEIVLDQTTGWVVDPQNPLKMAEACRTMLGLSSTQQGILAVQARERIVTHFSLPLMMGKTLGVYKELLEGKEDV